MGAWSDLNLLRFDHHVAADFPKDQGITRHDPRIATHATGQSCLTGSDHYVINDLRLTANPDTKPGGNHFSFNSRVYGNTPPENDKVVANRPVYRHCPTGHNCVIGNARAAVDLAARGDQPVTDSPQHVEDASGCKDIAYDFSVNIDSSACRKEIIIDTPRLICTP